MRSQYITGGLSSTYVDRYLLVKKEEQDDG